MENKKNSQKYSRSWYGSFDLEDTRYYGVFIKGNGDKQVVSVDPKRFQHIFNLPSEIKKMMDKRKGPLFHPAKKSMLDYNVNVIRKDIDIIKKEWNKTYKPFIRRFLEEIKGKNFNYLEDDNLHSGIVSFDEAINNARIFSWMSHEFAELEKKQLFQSLYSQYFHQLVSQIDASILRILTINGYEGDIFNRNVLYAFKGNKPEKIKLLDGFTAYDRMYSIWNFLKHNSLSTFNTLKNTFPEVLKEIEYKQGDLACFIINFTEDLIDSLLDGVRIFFIEYCCLVFDEDPQEAKWNSEEYFRSIVYNEIEEIQDPFGLRYSFY